MTSRILLRRPERCTQTNHTSPDVESRQNPRDAADKPTRELVVTNTARRNAQVLWVQSEVGESGIHTQPVLAKMFRLIEIVSHHASILWTGNASGTLCRQEGKQKSTPGWCFRDDASAISDATPGVCVTMSSRKAPSPRSSASSHATWFRPGLLPLRRRTKCNAATLSERTSNLILSDCQWCFHTRSATSKLRDSATCWKVSSPTRMPSHC